MGEEIPWGVREDDPEERTFAWKIHRTSTVGDVEMFQVKQCLHTPQERKHKAFPGHELFQLDAGAGRLLEKKVWRWEGLSRSNHSDQIIHMRGGSF